MKTDSNIQSKIIKFLPNDFFFFCRKLSLMGGGCKFPCIGYTIRGSSSGDCA